MYVYIYIYIYIMYVCMYVYVLYPLAMYLHSSKNTCRQSISPINKSSDSLLLMFNHYEKLYLLAFIRSFFSS